MSGGRECLYRTNQGSSNGSESVADAWRIISSAAFPFVQYLKQQLI